MTTFRDIIERKVDQEVKASWYDKLKEAIGRHFDLDEPYLQYEIEKVLDELPWVGEGSARKAYKLDVKDFDPVVFKIAKNPHGMEQNKVEVSCYQTGVDLLPEVYDWDFKYVWIEEELLQPISDDEFSKLAGLHMQTLYWLMDNWETDRGRALNKISSKITSKKAKVFLGQLDALIKGCRLEEGTGDLTRIDHWGKDHNGQLKILDFGFAGW